VAIERLPAHPLRQPTGQDCTCNLAPLENLSEAGLGYGRSTQLASPATAALNLLAGSGVVMEGLQRVDGPVAIGSTPVALATLVGLVVNLASARSFGPVTSTASTDGLRCCIG
jgi:Co/Zn/Cd efflux system component